MISARSLLSRVPVMVTVVFLISCLVVTPQTAYADLSVFTPSIADTFVESMNPDANYGLTGSMTVFTDATRNVRSLVKFDLSSIPPGSTINAAYLLLYVYGHDGFPASRTYVANRITRDWIETQATWNSYKTGGLWTNPGGDFVTAGAASTPGAVGGNWVTWTVTEIVKTWIQSGQPNCGFLIKDSAEGTGDTVIYFASRDAYESNLRPVLKVDWTPPRPVGGLVMPTNKIEILTPYLALAGLVVAISTVIVVKRRKD